MTRLKRGYKKILLQIYFPLIVFLSLCFISLSVFGFNEIQKARALLYSESQYEQDLNKKYHTLGFDQVFQPLYILCLLLCVCELLIGTLSLFAGYQIYKLSEQFNLMVFFNEVLVTAQALLSCLAICSLINTSAGLVNLPDIAPVPPILLEGTIVLSFLLILWAVIAFLCVYRQRKIGMIMSSFLTIITTFFLFVFCILLLLYIPYSKKELIRACSNILPILDDEYIFKAGCAYGKYKNVNTNINELTCPKEDIKFTWEYNYLEKTPEAEYMYGCINAECCHIVIADIRLVFTFTVIMLIILCIVSILSSVSIQINKSKMLSNGRKFYSLGDLVKGGHIAIFALLVAGIVFTVVYYSQNIYKAPTNPSFLEVDSPVAKSKKLGKLNFPENNYKDGHFKLNLTIEERHEDCDKSRDDLVYYATIKIKTYGRFYISPYVFDLHYVNFETFEYDTSIAFSCLFKDLNPILRMIQLETPYPAKENKLSFHIKAIHDFTYKENWGKKLLEEVQEVQNVEHVVFDEEVTYSIFPTRDKVMYRGRIMEKTRKEGSQPIPIASIKIVLMDEARSEIGDAETNQDGNFEVSLSLHVTYNKDKVEITPYQMLMTFSKEGYETAYLGMTVGAEGLEVDKNIDVIYLQRDYTNPFDLNVSGVLLNALNEKPVGKVYVSLLLPIKKTIRANKYGKFLFNSPEVCKYAQITIDDEGYYPINKQIPCAGEKIIPLVPIIGDYKLRSVLYWSKAIVDLDFHVVFQKDNKTECISDFTQIKCGGAIYKGDRNLINDSKGIEIIDLDVIGAHQYVFYVDAFPFNENVSIPNTKARVEVYSGALENPVIEIYPSHLNVFC